MGAEEGKGGASEKRMEEGVAGALGFWREITDLAGGFVG